jgi:hypothetical protein
MSREMAVEGMFPIIEARSDHDAAPCRCAHRTTVGRRPPRLLRGFLLLFLDFGLPVQPALESEDFFARTKAGKVQPAILAAPSLTSQQHFQAHEERWLIRLARPPVQIHTMAFRAAGEAEIGEHQGSGNETSLAIKAAQGRDQTKPVEFFLAVSGS